MNDFDDAELSPARREARARMMKRRRVTLLVAAAIVLALIIGGIAWAIAAHRGGTDLGDADSSARSQTPTASSSATGSSADEQDQDTQQPDHDVDSPDSLTVVVNKQRALPADWRPTDLVVPEGIENNWGDELRAPAAAALQDMYAAADAAGVPFIITSGFRDYDRQAALFDGYAASDGIEAAETYSARPGHSEHQTGLAVDLTDNGACSLEECFSNTEMGLWLRDNAWRYGFILRYEQGEQATVGYSYEPWHFRYVGLDVSTAMHDAGIANLEDYFGLPAAPGY